MENYNETKDFEEMRQQIGLLKEKLHTQRIVNEEIIRQTIQEKVSAVHNISWRIILIGLMEIPLVLWIFRGLLGFSWGFCLLTVAFVALAVVCHLLMDLSVNRTITRSDDLVAVRGQLLNVKKRSVQWLFFGLPFMLVWIGLLLWEAMTHEEMVEDIEYLALAVCIGVIAGLCIGLAIFFKKHNAIKEALRQIEMLKREE